MEYNIKPECEKKNKKTVCWFLYSANYFQFTNMWNNSKPATSSLLLVAGYGVIAYIHGVMIIVIGNEYGNTSSNPG